MTELPESFEEVRYGGAMGEEDGGQTDAQRKAAEREQKKAEVRKRLEEAGSKKRAKKGFLTPERKKKLRKLLMMKAAEDLKQQQLKREQERQSALGSRIPALPDLESINDHGKLESIYTDMFEKVKKLEEEKFDINAAVAAKDSEINELTIAVNDLRGKFIASYHVKPSLKKVSKYDNKFKKLNEKQEAASGDKKDFRSQLKVVKKENVLEELVQKKAKSDKPEWSNKNKLEKTKEEKQQEEKEEKPAGESAPPAEEPAAEEEEEEEEEGEEEEEE
uniref:Troponin I n=1 Tax=Panagrolaimus sp. ES5 TaxID=591445 RepID=A0AC34FG80_9BILA